MAPEAILVIITRIPTMSSPRLAVRGITPAEAEAIVSQERLRPYRDAAGGDSALAVHLYERNIELAECTFGALHILEVCIRNALHRELSAFAGKQDWYANATIKSSGGLSVPLTAPMHDTLRQALRNAGPGASSGKIIAELSFGFWTNLLASRFQQSLWTPSLHRAFPGFTAHPRKVHRRMEVIQRLRNRIAHHERILTSQNALRTGHLIEPLIATHHILECVNWADKGAGIWLQSGTRLNRATEILIELQGSGVLLN